MLMLDAWWLKKIRKEIQPRCPKISERHKDKHRSIKNPRRGTGVGIHIWGSDGKARVIAQINNKFIDVLIQIFS